MRRGPDLRGIETRRRIRTDGTALITYRVRWTGLDGSRRHRTFDDRDTAVAFRDDLDRRAALIADGPEGRRTMTVADCFDRWHREHVVPELAARTRASYEGVWRRHLSDRVGDDLAIDIRPRHIKALKGELLADDLGARCRRLSGPGVPGDPGSFAPGGLRNRERTTPLDHGGPDESVPLSWTACTSSCESGLASVGTGGVA